MHSSYPSGYRSARRGFRSERNGPRRLVTAYRRGRPKRYKRVLAVRANIVGGRRHDVDHEFDTVLDGSGPGCHVIEG
ncbi:hypothetical protein GCM10022235_41280 [Kribbella ginsengisoli]|uniref:Uncharacterized protein n=1 Tax=Kribbella ginsengisoli TaxID=363865 RepID=A0ABP6XPR4_9ACTN